MYAHHTLYLTTHQRHRCLGYALGGEQWNNVSFSPHSVVCPLFNLTRCFPSSDLGLDDKKLVMYISQLMRESQRFSHWKVTTPRPTISFESRLVQCFERAAATQNVCSISLSNFDICVVHVLLCVYTGQHARCHQDFGKSFPQPRVADPDAWRALHGSASDNGINQPAAERGSPVVPAASFARRSRGNAPNSSAG